MIAQALLLTLVILLVLCAVFYFVGIEPSKIVERWAAGLGNGGHFPEKPNVGIRYWLLPIHRELMGVAKKIKGLQGELKTTAERDAVDSFVTNCIFHSMLEGLLVVDEQRRVTRVNSEFLQIFGMTQSPLQAQLAKVLPPNSRVDQLVETAFQTGRVTGEVIYRKFGGGSGRPPAYEVRAVPLFRDADHVCSVIVLFLPPADRPRMAATLVRHSQNLNSFVNHLVVISRTKHRLPEIQVEDIEPNAFLEDVRKAFEARPDNKGINLQLNIAGKLPVFRADRAQLQSSLLQLVENTLFYAEEKPKIILSAEASDGTVRLMIAIEGADFPMQEVSLLSASPSESSLPTADPQIFGGISAFLSIRDSLKAHAGWLEVDVQQKNQVAFAVRFPSQDKPLETAAS